MSYSAAVFQNCGNYKSFGDTKFVPELEEEKLRNLIFSSKAYEQHKTEVENLWQAIHTYIYNEEDPYH